MASNSEKGKYTGTLTEEESSDDNSSKQSKKDCRGSIDGDFFQIMVDFYINRTSTYVLVGRKS